MDVWEQNAADEFEVWESEKGKLSVPSRVIPWVIPSLLS